MKKKSLKDKLIKLVKYMFLTISTVLVILVGLTLLATNFYNDQLRDVAMKKLNNQLASPISVEEVSLSVFSHFPLVSIELEKVFIPDSLTQNDTLLYSENLAMSFNAIDLLNGRYKIRMLTMNDGKINLHIDNRGVENYLVFKSNEEEESDQFKFVLDQLIFHDFRVNYKNDLLGQDYLFTFNESILKGDFTNKTYDIALESDLLINYFSVDNVNYIKNKNAKLDVVINVVNDPLLLTIDKGVLEIADMNFNILGKYEAEKNELVDLFIKGDKIKLSEVFSVFPIDYLAVLERYSSRGNLNFNAHLMGEISQNKTLLFEADFNADKAAFKDKENDIEMSKIDLEGYFNNHDRVLIIKRFSALIEQEKIEGSIRLKNFTNPNLTLDLRGGISLEKIPFFLPEIPYEMEGYASFNLATEIQLKSKETKVKSIKGMVKSANLSLFHPKNNFRADVENLNIAFPDKNLVIKAGSVKVNEDEIFPKIKLFNWMDLVFQKSSTLKANFDLNFNQLNLTQWENWLLPERSDSPDTTSSIVEYNIQGVISGKKILYNNIICQDISVKKIKITNRLSLNGLSFKGHGGEYYLNVSNESFETNKWLVDGRISRVKLKDLFNDFNDFDQDVIKAKHMEGRFSSDISASISFDSLGDIDLNNMKVNSANSFESIKIIDYPYLKDLVQYFNGSVITRNIVDVAYYQQKVDEVKFDDFSTKVTINKGDVVFGKTVLNNNVLDLVFLGEYQFNDTVDYRLNFNWADIVRKKKNKEDYDIKHEEKVKQLFLKIWGHIDDLNYGFDQNEMKKERKEKIKEEKENIKKALKGEDLNNESEHKPPEFEVEWEDGDTISEDTVVLEEKKPKKPKKNKDSTKINKLLRKLGVEDEKKEDPVFEIDQ